MKNLRVKKVKQSDVGTYVWKLPNGNILANEDGEILNCPAVRGDIGQQIAIAKAARHYGYPEGEAVFEEVHRCTEAEYWEQMDQLVNQGISPQLNIRR